jgi:hypothetical protein
MTLGNQGKYSVQQSGMEVVDWYLVNNDLA